MARPEARSLAFAAPLDAPPGVGAQGEVFDSENVFPEADKNFD